MRKVLMTQAMTENGISRFDGLYDENGFPVTAELEKNEDGVVFTQHHKERTDAEKQAVCDEYDDCADCPIRGICAKDLGSDNLF